MISPEELQRGRLYSEELGIDLAGCQDTELFKWFLASLLFGGRISETIARRTYGAFAAHRLLSPEKILAAGWDFLVSPVMREGGYVRYDGRKSDQVLRNCRQLLDWYGNSLNHLHAQAENSDDLEKRIQAFYGVGPVTANIFLRELRPVWAKADPAPLAVVQQMACKLGINLDLMNRKSLAFVRLEASLIRLRHQHKPSSHRA